MPKFWYTFGTQFNKVDTTISDDIIQHNISIKCWYSYDYSSFWVYDSHTEIVAKKRALLIVDQEVVCSSQTSCTIFLAIFWLVSVPGLYILVHFWYS